jgi:hypothetical protein
MFVKFAFKFVKSFELKFDFPLHEAEGSQISPLHYATGNQISPPHFAMGSQTQTSPLHDAVGSQVNDFC